MIITSCSHKSVKIDSCRTPIVYTHGVDTYAIDTNHYSLVLNSTSTQQSVPCHATLIGPVGYINSNIIVIAVAAKDGESQVVAHLQKEAHSAKLYYNTFCTSLVMLVFTRITEQMTLVIMSGTTIGLYKIHSVFVASIESNGSHTTNDSSIGLSCHTAHPL